MIKNIFDEKQLIVRIASSELDLDKLLGDLKKLKGKDTVVQIFDDTKIFGRTHLIGAYVNSLVVFKNKTNRTKDIGMEMLLFASLTDQIGKGIEIAGAKTNSHFVLFLNKKSMLKRLDGIIKIGNDFKLSDSEMRKRAKLIGIKTEGLKKKDIELMLLQKMAVSRLVSD